MIRRSLVLACLLGHWPGVRSHSRRSVADPLRLGVERALVDAGLAQRLLRGFSRYGGLKVQMVPGTSAQALSALEQGEVEAALSNAPEIETRLEQQGLAHDRQPVAWGDLVLVGPPAAKRGRPADPTALDGRGDIVSTLAELAQAQARFFSAPEGSGAYLAESSLWRQAQVAPCAPWYIKTPAGEDALGQAAAQGGYTLIERGCWLAKGRKPLVVRMEGDLRMAIGVHVMRSFRVHHPAAKLFVQWVTGPQGEQVVRTAPGWNSPRSR